MEDKRHSERVQKKIKAEVHAKDGMTFSSSVDISKGGLFLTTPEPLREGEEVDLSIKVDDQHYIDAKGIIRWSRDENEKTLAGMGIEFVGVTPEGQEKLNALLEK